MDTRQVVARFEAERQALALMDHPNIAKVFDGGATPSGRPYFVMELVKGVPITEFCDQNHLTPRQRLELFVAVCQAVQHAHQKGIIHRDLKPSNVLVTVHDATPVVKVIDFGVAKALGQELTDKTLFTGFAQMIGTPLYMSPEQAGHERPGRRHAQRHLLAGRAAVRAADRHDAVRPRSGSSRRPTTRSAGSSARRSRPSRARGCRESKDSLPSISAQRQTEPAKLTKLVRGELDWIVMKALEKDRNRRYETANGFAADVQRYLADEPVQACPPSAGYRLRKFVRRNKAALAMASVLAAALVLAVVGLSVSNLLVAPRTRSEDTSLIRQRASLGQRKCGPGESQGAGGPGQGASRRGQEAADDRQGAGAARPPALLCRADEPGPPGMGSRAARSHAGAAGESAAQARSGRSARL